MTALIDIAPGGVPDIDLDAICFGFDTCNYLAGGPGNSAGTFHATAPTRILDTRTFTGITNGPVRTGDGRHPSPDPITRRDETANHDLQVTGLNGIPASGVSAVLLNVTAVGAGAPGPGFMSVIPKPPRAGDVFNDQGSYGAFPNTSNLNLESADPTPNLVLARVGAGGKIRLYNYLGPTHVIADVAGWFGTGGAHTDGTGFTGVVPSRLLDSRNAIGTPGRQFAAGETRNLKVAGVAGVPANAESVVVNVTMVGSPGSGYVTAYPTGGALPNASNVNIVPGGVRANTSVVKVGTGGQISLFVAETSSDVIVDVLGSYGPGGGRVTDDHAGALRRQPVWQRHSGTPVQRERGPQHPDRRPRQRPRQRDGGDRQRDGRRSHRVGFPVGVAGRCGAAHRVEPQLPRRPDGAEPRDDEARCRRCDLDRQRPRRGPRPRRRDGLRRLTVGRLVVGNRVSVCSDPRVSPTTRNTAVTRFGGEE